MQSNELPALYRSADEFSLDAQAHFFCALKLHLILLVLAATLSVCNIAHWSIAAVQLVALLGALSCSIYLFSMRPDRLWYAARAVAESIKTITWRYVCRAEPFQDEDDVCREEFYLTLRQIVEQNKEVCQSFFRYLDAPQITDAMTQMRLRSLEERRSFYAEHRIRNQLTWYARKASFNRNASNIFFWALIITNSVAVIFGVIRVAHADLPFWPTDVFVAAAASLLSWMQAKRFSELAASYALAAHEIGLISDQSMSARSDESFSKFVGDAENAFSREHTQWVARKDV